MFLRNNLLVGPLSEASMTINQFCTNLFATALVQQTMQRLEMAEQEYEKICQIEGACPKDIMGKKVAMDACHASMQIAVNFLLNGEDTVQ